MSPSMTGLELEREGDDWRLHLSGDWSLTAMAQIEAQLRNLPGGLRGTLVCDWSGAEAPGIGPVWALLLRLAELGPNLSIRHSEYPPHHLPLLQKLEAERHASEAAPEAPHSRKFVGELGHWAILQGTHARLVV